MGSADEVVAEVRAFIGRLPFALRPSAAAFMSGYCRALQDSGRAGPAAAAEALAAAKRYEAELVDRMVAGRG